MARETTPPQIGEAVPAGTAGIYERFGDKLRWVASAAGALAIATGVVASKISPAQAQDGGSENVPFMVGGFDSIGEQLNPNDSGNVIRKIRKVGFGYLKEEVTWVNRQKDLSDRDKLALGNSIEAADEYNLKVILLFLPATWKHQSDSKNVPVRPNQQRDFCDMVSNVLREFPGVAAVQIGNEENNPVFWRPQFLPDGTDAVAKPYESLLARCYDDVKAINPDIQVIGGGLAPRGNDDPHSLRPSHSPVNLILDIGKAYQASGRTEPIMDSIGVHPYILPGETLETTHPAPSTTIGAADYQKLVKTLSQAFDFVGSGQEGANLPVIYDEFARKAERSNQPSAGDDAVPVNVQIADYDQLLHLARCDQPTVEGVIFFKIFNNPEWTSGMYNSEGQRNSNFYEISKAVKDAQDPSAACE